jgi:hypothetical protein
MSEISVIIYPQNNNKFPNWVICDDDDDDDDKNDDADEVDYGIEEMIWL